MRYIIELDSWKEGMVFGRYAWKWFQQYEILSFLKLQAEFTGSNFHMRTYFVI